MACRCRQAETRKTDGSLLIRRIHRRGTPKLVFVTVVGTQSRGGHHRKRGVRGSHCPGGMPLTLRGRT